MSADFEPLLVKDDTIGHITDKLKYAVYKGAMNKTVSKFESVSKSTSQITWNVQVPSELTIIDRRVMVRCDFTIQLTGTAPAGGYLVNYGSSDALGPFPFHQLISTFQATINNNTVNLNTQDVLNCIIRSNDNRELQAFNGLTPVMYDTYHSYADAVLANNNPNGSYVVQSDYDIAPRGAYFVDPVMTGNTIGPGAKTVNIKVSVVEPLLISPFIFADPKSNNGGMAGIQNLTFTANLAANAHRAFRSANSYITNAVVTDIDKAELIFNFLTPHVGSTMPSRQICPYYELPRYISKVGVPIPNGATVRIESQSLQLNVIPDKLFIFCRKTLGSQKVQDADSFLPIKGISINFNNQSGILSSATPYDLYRFSREAGSNQNFNEFQGRALRNNPTGGAPLQIPTTGSMLMLNMGQHVQLTEGWYAPKNLLGRKSVIEILC